MSDAAHPSFEGGDRLLRLALVLTLVGAIGWGASCVANPPRALAALLAAEAWLASTLLGALILLLSFHATNARWPVVLQRLIEAMVAALPVVVVLAVPLLLGLDRIFPWTDPASLEPSVARVVAHQGAWWARPFFIVRTIVYGASWLLIGELFRRWSLREDADGDPGWRARAHFVSGPALIVVAFTLTFASFDWLMSLTPAWISSVYGVYVFAGGFVAAMAVAVLLAQATRARVPVGPGHFLSIGKLLLAHVVFWAYIAFAQYFIPWIADLPREVGWWKPRVEGWAGVTIALVLVQFVVPFAVLLSRDLKRDAKALSIVSGWLVVAHAFDAYWLVLPSLHPEPTLHPSDPAAFLLAAGASLACGVYRSRAVPLVPIHAPALAVSARYEGT